MLRMLNTVTVCVDIILLLISLTHRKIAAMGPTIMENGIRKQYLPTGVNLSVNCLNLVVNLMFFVWFTILRISSQVSNGDSLCRESNTFGNRR